MADVTPTSRQSKPKLPSLAKVTRLLGSLPRLELPRLRGPLARTFDRINAQVGIALTYGSRIAVFILIAGGGGLGSAWYMTNHPTDLTAVRSGAWVAWIAAGRPDADPYTRVRFARMASLPLNAAAVLTYEAQTDSDGRRLQSSCDYVVEGPEPPARWWSLAVYDERGRVIPNPADRYAFNSSSITRNIDGTIAVTLSRDARPGNWLPVGAGGRLMLTLSLHGVSTDAAMGDVSGAAQPELPIIRRQQCA